VGTSDLRELAKIKIRIGSKVLDETVALASNKELDGKGLVAINLKKKGILGIIEHDRATRIGCECDRNKISKERTRK